MHARTLLLVFAAAGTAVGAVSAPNPQEVVRKSVDAIQWDWAQASKYSYLERDVDSKQHSAPMAKTFRVLMIQGSPYEVTTAIKDHPLPADEKAAEQRKLQREIEKRQNESARERERRIGKFAKEQGHDHQMLKEMVDAFQFHLAGQAQVDRRTCWVLDAVPKPGYEPRTREGRVLKGMKGRLWIDQATNQWVKVHAEVVRTVSFYGFLAKVSPGTEFDLEQEPVADNVWMPKAFSVRVHSTALGFFTMNSTENDTYRDYQPTPQASALLQSTQ